MTEPHVPKGSWRGPGTEESSDTAHAVSVSTTILNNLQPSQALLWVCSCTPQVGIQKDESEWEQLFCYFLQQNNFIGPVHYINTGALPQAIEEERQDDFLGTTGQNGPSYQTTHSSLPGLTALLFAADLIHNPLVRFTKKPHIYTLLTPFSVEFQNRTDAKLYSGSKPSKLSALQQAAKLI